MMRRVLFLPRQRLAFLAVFPFLSVLLFASCTKQSGSSPVSVSVPKPLDLGSKEVLGYIAIPNLDRILKETSALANLFAPGKTTPEQLKAQLGAMLGDPPLANLEMEKPLVLLLLKSTQPGAPPSFAGMIPAKKGAPYEQALAALGMQARFSGGLLLAAQTPDGLDAAAKIQGVYERISGARIQKSGRVFLQIAALMESFGPLLESQVDNFIQMIPAGMAMTGGNASAEHSGSVATLLKLEFKGLLALLNQCEVLQVDLDLADQRIGIDKVVTAKPGTALLDSFTRSSRCSSPATGLIEGGGFLTGAMCFDAKSLADLFKQVFDAVSKEPGGAMIKEMAAISLDMGDWWGGTGAFSMRPGKDAGFTLAYDMDILDEAKYLAAMEKVMAMLSPGTALSDLYKGMGLEFSVKFEKAARQHAGLPVHRWKMSLNAKEGKLPPGTDLGMMKAFVRDMEFASVKGHGLLSNEPSLLDSMIDQAQSSAKRELTFQALKSFGAGRQMYFDYDLIGLFKIMLSTMPEGPAKQQFNLLSNVKSTEPMVFALTFDEGRAQAQINIPLKPFAQMVPRQD